MVHSLFQNLLFNQVPACILKHALRNCDSGWEMSCETKLFLGETACVINLTFLTAFTFLEAFPDQWQENNF